MRAGKGRKEEGRANLGHPIRRLLMWASRQLRIHLFAAHRLEDINEFRTQRVLYFVVILVLVGLARDEGGDVDLPDGRDECDDLDPVCELEVFLRYGTSSHSA